MMQLGVDISDPDAAYEELKRLRAARGWWAQAAAVGVPAAAMYYTGAKGFGMRPGLSSGLVGAGIGLVFLYILRQTI